MDSHYHSVQDVEFQDAWDKPLASENVAAVATGDTDHSLDVIRPRNWEFGSSSRTPILELVAVMSSLLLAALSAFVLVYSRGKPINTWNPTPAVYLSVISTIFNNVIRYAVARGLVISWWNQALRGTTLKDLHLTWEYGTSMKSVYLTPSFRVSKVRLIGIFASLLAATGPLLQRASSIITVQQNFPTEANLPIRLQPMWNLTSYFNQDSDDAITFYQPEMGGALLGMTNKLPMNMPTNATCDAICHANVTIAGFDRDCSADRGSLMDMHVTDKMAQFAKPHTVLRSDYIPQFQVLTEFAGGETGDNFTINSLFYDDITGSTVQTYNCSLRPAFIQLSLNITNGSISINRDADWTRSRTLSLYDQTLPPAMYTTAPFGQAISDMYDSLAFLEIEDQTYYFQGASARKYTNESTLSMDVNQTFHSFSVIGFTNPLPDLLASLDELSLRYAMQTIPALTGGRLFEYQSFNYLTNFDKAVNKTAHSYPQFDFGTSQNIAMEAVSQKVVFVLNWNFLAAALAVMVLNIIGALTALSGWRMIGREVSMSPLELAKAFDPEILHEAGSNMTAEEIVEVTGSRRVRYGAVAISGGESRRRLAVTAETEASLPTQGAKYY
ncbi:MAG: hypothetical protein Q9165_002480 [Trypethelium subeluteriae]